MSRLPDNRLAQIIVAAGDESGVDDDRPMNARMKAAADRFAALDTDEKYLALVVAIGGLMPAEKGHTIRERAVMLLAAIKRLNKQFGMNL